MTPQIRQLFADAKAKVAEARQLLTGSPSAENRQAAKDLLREAGDLDEQAKALLKGDQIIKDADDAEAQEQEATRRAAEAAANARGAGTAQPAGAQGSRGTAQNSQGETEITDQIDLESDEARSVQASFQAMFRDMLEEHRARETPEDRQRARAFRFAMLNGPENLRPEFRHLVETRDITEQEDDEIRAMGVQSQSSLGILVPEAAMRDVALAQLAFGGFRATRTDFFQTSHGLTVPSPTIDDTSNEGSYQGEHAAVPDGADLVAEPHALGAHPITSGVMKVSTALARDENFGLENRLLTLGGVRIERRFQRALTTGTGTGQPAGLATTITTGNTAANAAEFVQADFYNLKGHPTDGVNAAYHGMSEWMLSSDALLKLKLAQLGTGQGIWQPGLGNSAPPTIDGDGYAVNYHMDTVATGNVPVFYGDFWWMKAREVVPLAFIRLVELYAGNSQIGFILAGANDGREVNPGVPALKKMTMA